MVVNAVGGRQKTTLFMNVGSSKEEKQSKQEGKKGKEATAKK